MNLNVMKFVSAAVWLSASAVFADGHAVTQAELDAAQACPTSNAGEERIVCACNAGKDSGSIWGSNPYTGDSATCAAAAHAGALEAGVGLVVLLPTGRQESFPASTQNGVTSNSWGVWETSFSVFPARVQAAAAAAGAVEVSAADIAAAGACPSNIGVEKANLLCRCPAGDSAGSVWGSGPYTADSNLCTAARHAGAVGGAGGLVFVTAADGQESYEGSDANGVTTRDWGRYGRSILLAAAVEAGTAPGGDSPVAACSILPSGVDRLSCSCPADDGTRGSIYGAGPYTADSDICTAARHDGAVAREGGVVTVLRIGGLESYAATDRNGITPRGWGGYSSSIVFDRNAD